jgi:hypothetical protein
MVESFMGDTWDNDDTLAMLACFVVLPWILAVLAVL